MKSLKGLFLIITVLCFASVPALARNGQDITKSGPCKADVQKFCKNVRSGNGRVMRCMKQYDRHLSDACRQHIAEVKEKTSVFANVCGKDVKKFCADVKPGDGRVYACLKQHRPDLAARCADYVR